MGFEPLGWKFWLPGFVFISTWDKLPWKFSCCPAYCKVNFVLLFFSVPQIFCSGFDFPHRHYSRDYPCGITANWKLFANFIRFFILSTMFANEIGLFYWLVLKGFPWPLLFLYLTNAIWYNAVQNNIMWRTVCFPPFYVNVNWEFEA